MDTSFIRGVVHGDAPALRDLETLKAASAYSYALTDASLAEVTIALLEDRIPWNMWHKGVQLLAEIINGKCPVLSWGDRLWGHGIRGAGNNALWNHICEAKQPGDMERPFQFTTAAQGELHATTCLEYASTVHESTISHWKDQLNRATAILQTYRSQTGVSVTESLLLSIADLCPIPGIQPSLLDAHSRVFARYILLYNSGSYNPLSRKGKRDAYDFYQLKFLAWPALLCTLDGRFKSIVTATRSWQSGWVQFPHEITGGDVASGSVPADGEARGL